MKTSKKTTSNPIIQNRLEHLKGLRSQTLSLKKKDRGDRLKSINETISRLRLWQKELDAKDQKKIRNQKIIIVDKNGNYHQLNPDEINFEKEYKRIEKTKNIPKALTKTHEAINKMKESFSRARSVIEDQIHDEFANLCDISVYEAEFLMAERKRRENKLQNIALKQKKGFFGMNNDVLSGENE